MCTHVCVHMHFQTSKNGKYETLIFPCPKGKKSYGVKNYS